MAARAYTRPLKQQAGGKFRLQLLLPRGKFHFKYVVDSKWVEATDQLHALDSSGNRNNVVVVSDALHKRAESHGAWQPPLPRGPARPPAR